MTPAPIAELERCLARLPGLGHRSAARAAFALVRDPARLLAPLADALRAASDGVKCCSRCGAFTVVGSDPCGMCIDASRNGRLVCVVEDPSDIAAIEESGAFKGRYHVLGGKLSPAHRTGPEKLRIAQLRDRIADESFTEVLLALSTDMDGDATAGYLTETLAGSGVKVTRLAFGLPAGSGVAYSDPLTLRRAIGGRVQCG